jgi:hypothetical protein
MSLTFFCNKPPLTLVVSGPVSAAAQTSVIPKTARQWHAFDLKCYGLSRNQKSTQSAPILPGHRARLQLSRRRSVVGKLKIAARSTVPLGSGQIVLVSGIQQSAFRFQQSALRDSIF